VDRRDTFAAIFSAVYLAACILALWDRLGAILLLAAASPLAASFMFPKGMNMLARILLGASIDAVLGALVFVPVIGDMIDLGASVVAMVLLIVKFKRLASSLPGGLACLLLYLFIWFEAGFFPHRFSVSTIHHVFWFYIVAVIISALVGGAILAVLATLLGMMYEGDRTHAVFCTIGFPWYFIMFFLTIFLPNSHVRHAHQAAETARYGM
jgi:hypothetical protein